MDFAKFALRKVTPGPSVRRSYVRSISPIKSARRAAERSQVSRIPNLVGSLFDAQMGTNGTVGDVNLQVARQRRIKFQTDPLPLMPVTGAAARFDRVASSQRIRRQIRAAPVQVRVSARLKFMNSRQLFSREGWCWDDLAQLFCDRKPQIST